MIRSALDLIKNSVGNAQKLNNLSYPVDYHTSIKKCIIPRRSSLPFKDHYSKGIDAEWVEWKSPSTDKVILYAHGGAFVIGKFMD